jgi:hypothetical protein
MKQKLKLEEERLQDCNDQLFQIEEEKKKLQLSYNQTKKEKKDLNEEKQDLQEELREQRERIEDLIVTNEKLLEQLQDAQDRIEKLESFGPTTADETPGQNTIDTLGGYTDDLSHVIEERNGGNEHALLPATDSRNSSISSPRPQRRTIAEEYPDTYFNGDDLVADTLPACTKSQKRRRAVADGDLAVPKRTNDAKNPFPMGALSAAAENERLPELEKTGSGKRRRLLDKRNMQRMERPQAIRSTEVQLKKAPGKKKTVAQEKATVKNKIAAKEKTQKAKENAAASGEQGLEFLPCDNNFKFEVGASYPSNTKTTINTPTKGRASSF